MALEGVGSGRYRAIVPPSRGERGAREEARNDGLSQDVVSLGGTVSRSLPGVEGMENRNYEAVVEESAA